MHNDNNLRVAHLLERIAQSLEIVLERCENIHAVNDFLDSPDGMSLLDGVCMKLIAVGESIKNLDKLTNAQLFPRYPHIPWREIMGMRDIIVHHYFEIDAEVILVTIREGVPPLLAAIKDMRQEF
ncbi:HepT-like ribonuclease domain-containing protein [Bacteroides sp.]